MAYLSHVYSRVGIELLQSDTPKFISLDYLHIIIYIHIDTHIHTHISTSFIIYNKTIIVLNNYENKSSCHYKKIYHHIEEIAGKP